MSGWLSVALSALKTVATVLKLRAPKPGPDVAPVRVTSLEEARAKRRSN